MTTMIRNIVVGKLRPGVEQAQIEPGLAAIAALAPAGLLDVRVGVDQRLRDTTWDFAITSDFADVAAYRAYDVDEEHNRIRRDLIAPLCEQITRVQIEA